MVRVRRRKSRSLGLRKPRDASEARPDYNSRIVDDSSVIRSTSCPSVNRPDGPDLTTFFGERCRYTDKPCVLLGLLERNQTSRCLEGPMPAQSIDQLKSSFRGELIQPTDAGYESARKVYNGMIDKRPRLIARCVDVADVMAAVNFGRENGLLTAIRGGGHNGAGLGTCDDGLVIDLSRMKGIRVDPAG